MFGASGSIIPQPGDLDLTVSYRGLHSDDHYNGTIPQNQRQEPGTYVVNTQQVLDLYGSYAVTRRLSFAASVPYIDASWSIPTPIGSVGPRAEQNGRGRGDEQTGNLSVSLGCKAPTGDYDQRDEYPDLLSGSNDTMKVVDQSVQPGDGDWGIVLGLQGFKRARKTA